MSDESRQTLIIADPDPDFVSWATKHLAAPSLDIVSVNRSDEALAQFLEREADAILAEMHLEPFDGLELLKRIRQNLPNAIVLLNSAYTSTNAVIEAMRLGAYDVLRRESLTFELRPAIEIGLQASEQMRLAADAHREPEPTAPNPDLIIGRSHAMQDVFKLIGRVARADAPVLITSESGCGKEVVANAIHKYSRRASNEYVAINCAAIPGNLLESELFGHEKGAFTGAVSQRVGRFEQCDGGTLFLDEIGDMPLEVQSKLLRVLQSGEFSRVGGNQTLRSNVRILAATNKHLEQEVSQNQFREDLFYRLNVVRIHIPPLRRRSEDIPLLAEHFLSRMAESNKGRRMTLSPEALEKLSGHDWPGNVRELENTLQRACVLATGSVLLPKDLPFGSDAPSMLSSGASAPATEEFAEKAPGAEALDGSSSNGSEGDLSTAAERLIAAAEGDENLSPLEVAEREVIRLMLRRHEGNQAETARALGITRPTLRKRIDGYGLELQEKS